MSVNLGSSAVPAHFHSGETSVPSNAITFSAGDLAILVVCQYDTGTVTQAVTATINGNAMTVSLDTGDVPVGGENMRITILHFPNMAAGSFAASPTIAAHAGVTTVFLMNGTGCATSSPSDSAGHSASGTSGTAAPGAATSAASDDLWIGVWCGPQSPVGDSTVAGPFAIPANGKETDGNNWLCAAVAFLANPGATSENPVFTLTGTSFWLAAVTAYKALAVVAGDLSTLIGEPVTGSSPIEGGLR